MDWDVQHLVKELEAVADGLKQHRKQSSVDASAHHVDYESGVEGSREKYVQATLETGHFAIAETQVKLAIKHLNDVLRQQEHGQTKKPIQ